jgi:hypothetical protein
LARWRRPAVGGPNFERATFSSGVGFEDARFGSVANVGDTEVLACGGQKLIEVNWCRTSRPSPRLIAGFITLVRENEFHGRDITVNAVATDRLLLHYFWRGKDPRTINYLAQMIR